MTTATTVSSNSACAMDRKPKETKLQVGIESWRSSWQWGIRIGMNMLHGMIRHGTGVMNFCFLALSTF